LELDTTSGGIVKDFGQTEHSAAEAGMVQGKCEIVTNFLRTIPLRGLAALTKAQNQALMQAGLKAILESDLGPAMFPSFMAREMFAPF
jgi:hypothetical protein